MKEILLAFIPIFVAVDAIGVLPIFVSFTEGLDRKKRAKIILQSVITAVCIAMIFVYLGKAVFRFLKITIGDFMVAGGILLFCIAIIDIIDPTKKRNIPADELGFVPLGTPLITGPAVLTTSLIILDAYGMGPTLISILSNVILAGVIFLLSDFLIKILGIAGTRALSKIMSLLLAAIAVMMIRRGIVYMLAM